MPLDLPRAAFGFLPRSPLELVVCQVRHDDRTVDAKAALAIQEALGGPGGFFPRIEQVELRVASVTVGPGIAPVGTTEAFDGWHLKSADGSWTAALLPGHFSLETTAYVRWDDFEARFAQLVRAVSDNASPVLEQRLGLRYVDRLVGLDVRAPAGWSRWIADSIVGPATHPVLGEAVTSTRQQIDLDLGGGHSCVLRHGMIKDSDAPDDAEASYLLDFDIYSSQSRRFTAEGVSSLTRSFHEKADALFQQVITPELIQYLAGDQNV